VPKYGGSPLHAHGSDVVQFGGTYYWYGSAPRDTNNSLPFAAFGGINVYSSTDLNNWQYDGMAVTPTSSGTLSKNLVAYNPQVLYNSGTGRPIPASSGRPGVWPTVQSRMISYWPSASTA